MQRLERSIPFCIFLISLAVFSVARMQIVSLSAEGRRQIRCLTGDEPSYLLITHSIVADRDFNLYNQCINRDSRFFGVEKCGGHAARRDLDKKEVYSIHLPGLPLLLASPYALALRTHVSPRAMACLFMNFLAALLAVQLYLFCREIAETGNQAGAGWKGCGAALLGTAAVVFTPPVIFYSNLAYPDLPGALLILYAFRISINPDFADSRSRHFAASLCIAFLPWLSFRFFPASIILLSILLWHIGKGTNRRTLRLCFAAGAFALSMLFLMLYQHRAFGTINPSEGYRLQDFGRRGFMGTGGLCGMAGLLLDQGHGLLAWSPVYILSFTGLVFLVRERRAQGLWLSVLLLGIYMPAASFVHWWGGFAPPPRFMVVAAPLLGGALCYALCRVKRYSFPMLFCALLVLSFWFAYRGCAHPLRLYRHQHILTGFYPDLMGTVFPSLLHPRRSTWPLTALWVLLLTLVTLYYAVDWRRRARGNSV